MPKLALKPCRHPGCAELTDGAYCDEHGEQHRQAYEKRRGSAAQRGYDKRWQKIRSMFLRANPLCCDPFGDHFDQIVASEEADHITPKADGGGDGWDNLQPLCKSCHSKKTGKERSGWRQRGKVAQGVGGTKYLRDLDIRPTGGFAHTAAKLEGTT